MPDTPSEANSPTSMAETVDRLLDVRKAAKDAIEVADSVPELYRVKCFEVLLSYFLTGKTIATERISEKSQTPSTPEKPQIRTEVKALLLQYSVPEDVVTKKFFVDGMVAPHYRLDSPEKMATAKLQIVYAVLLALENALRTGKFEFSIEEVRTKCKDAHRIDHNFNANFRNNKNLFGSLSDPDHVTLSSDGKAELADNLLALK